MTLKNKMEIGYCAEVELEGCLNIRFVWIAPAATVVGSPDHERKREPEERQFEVEFTSGYWIAAHLTTVGQWNRVMGKELDGPVDLPVTRISWHDAASFCDILTQAHLSLVPKDYVFSLPSETQWEHACRADSNTRYHSGNTVEDLERVAWVGTNSGGTTQPVGKKLPNSWGLYDMHGNVGEWCRDAYGEYPSEKVVDYLNTVSAGQEPLKVVRSAHAMHPVDGVFRTAARGYGFPNEGSPFIGFRICLGKKQMPTRFASPLVSSIEWGEIEIEGHGFMKDAKLFPGGAREWNWNETNTRHVPGIQVADVKELLDHGAKIIILSKGMELALKTCPDTIVYLQNRNVVVYSEESNYAVELYNKLAKRGEPVGALIHSTC